MPAVQETYSWDTSFLSSGKQAPNPQALIVLNQPFARATLLRLWSKCQWRIFADGGSNHVYDTFGQEERQQRVYLPHHIKGDLDSIRPEVQSWYEDHGVVAERDRDQDSTDLMKSLAWVDDIEKETGSKLDVVILGGLSGRLDHTVHTMSLLHQLRNSRPRIFVVSGESVGWVLNQACTPNRVRFWCTLLTDFSTCLKGHHLLELDLRLVGPTCGLLPVGITSTILTTTGLKWNLANTESSFDGLVSTSNSILASTPSLGQVEITTSEPIWWCAEYRVTAHQS
ncbi:Thiamine pyrophosphokinase [Ceratobasidium theobromae]|uniref:Thiamine pyrophosphokinase n=1 Tax=Ceratobasidium theobromae TaxID=1582974 RepID=A0A5N5QGW0_9AGAM|nr:Thiamine pyrophosphokinase [Ceratobasidium theobromae]